MTVSDLSPDALAQLEAKLVADLDMVRKVRALLEEHRPSFTSPSPAPTPPVLPQTTVTAPAPAPVLPAAPSRSWEEIAIECLAALADEPFAPKDLAQAIHKVVRTYPEGSTIKTFINRMIRKGHVVIVEARTGRNGSLYRSTFPRPSAETPPAATENAPSPGLPPSA